MAEIRKVVTETKERVVGHTCDLCKTTTTDKAGNWPGPTSGEWDQNKHVTRLEYRHGHWVPDTTDTIEKADICPECWITKVKPAIVALGVQFREIDD